MHKIYGIIPVLLLTAYCALPQDQTNFNMSILPNDIGLAGSPPKAIPTIHISSADVVQGSVQEMTLSGDKFVVRWTFTEAGAKKMLEFREAHDRQKVRTDIGSFDFIGTEYAGGVPPGCTNYSQWRDGWLKHRTDKFFGVSKDDANKIIAGLKGQ